MNIRKQGFFTGDLVSRTPLPLVPLCGACGLYKDCLSPKMPVYGKGNKQILVIGDYPGQEEDFQGKPFVGRSGQLLKDTLRRYGIELSQDCWVSNALICKPNKKTKDRNIDYCRPNIVHLIQHLKPKAILLVGTGAVRSVIGWSWKGDPGGMSRWAGFTIPDRRINAWICPTFNPAFIMRNKKDGKEQDPAEIIWNRHLENFSRLEERPYESVPDDSLRIRKIMDSDKAVALLKGMVASRVPLAFDYECLVPNTKVLTDDFRWVPIGKLRVGDELTAFEEYASLRSGKRKLTRAKVLAVKRFKAPCVRITMEDGRTIEASTNHPWLTKNIHRVTSWVRSDHLKTGDKIRQLSSGTWEFDESWQSGWLAGFFDGEGYVTGRTVVAFAQVEGDLFNKALVFLDNFGFDFKSYEKKVPTTSKKQMMAVFQGTQSTLNFIGKIRPYRLLKNFQRSMFSGLTTLPNKEGYGVVKNVVLVGEREVVGVTTNTGTYIAEGLCSHNTSMLKPDDDMARIVCCSFSDGVSSIAFPWYGKIRDVVREVLLDPSVAKVGWNIKFEERWTCKEFGRSVANWVFDGMLAAHVLDSRKGTKSLKFQSYARLGVESYNDAIEPYLKSKDGKGGNSPNNIDDISMSALLGYCAEDSLREHQLAYVLAKELGIKL